MSKAEVPASYKIAEDLVSEWLGENGDKYVDHLGSPSGRDLVNRVASLIERLPKLPREQKIARIIRDYCRMNKSGAVTSVSAIEAARAVLALIVGEAAFVAD